MFTCYRFLLVRKETIQFKQNGFHFRHLRKDLSQARPVTSDVSHYVRVTLILIKAVLSKCRKLEILLKSFKDLFQSIDNIELMSDERTSLDHNYTIVSVFVCYHLI